MKNIFIIALSLWSFNAFSQIVYKNFDSDELNQFLTSRIQVVLTGNAEFDSVFITAIEKQWSLTPFDFIDSEELVSSLQDNSKFFLMILTYKLSYDTQGQLLFHDCKLFQGGQTSLANITYSSFITSINFSYWFEQKIEDASYRFEYMIKGMNDGVKLIVDRKLKSTNGLRTTNFNEEINVNTIDFLKTKTLVVNLDQLNLVQNKKDKESAITEKMFIDSKYPYKYKFVSESEFKEILQDNENDYLCLLPIFTYENVILTIYETSSKKSVYIKEFKNRSYKIKEQNIKEIFN